MNPRTGEVRPAAPAITARRMSLIGTALGFVGPLGFTIYTPAMPTLVEVFDTSMGTIKLTLTAYLLGLAFGQLVSGPLSDAYGRRVVLIGSMALFLAATLLILFSNSAHLFLAARLLQGIGGAGGVAVSRAMIRDLFTGQVSARIMNAIAIGVPLGAVIAPTVGGIAMDLVNWHAVFALLVVYGILVLWMAVTALPETLAFRDPSRFRPRQLLRTYATILTDTRFLQPVVVFGASIGTVHTMISILPFLLMDRIGMTPTQFGLGVMIQPITFASGSILVRFLLDRYRADALLPFGIWLCTAATVLLGLSLLVLPVSYWSVMIPHGLLCFAGAFVQPGALTRCLAPFPQTAGSASALIGFTQFGMGLVGSSVGALIDDPVKAIIATIPPMMVGSTAVWVILGRVNRRREAAAVAPPLAPDLPPKG